MPVYLTAYARTPITGKARAQAQLTAEELGAKALNALLAQHRGTPDLVICGNSVGSDGNIARKVALGAGLNIPALTVDAQCGAGLVTLAQATHHVAATKHTVVAGGTESVSTAASVSQAPFTPRGQPDPQMTQAADRYAAELGMSRNRQNDFARESHRRALASPYRNPADDGPRLITESLAQRFQPVYLEQFREDATVTALSAAGLADAAALVMLSPSPAESAAEAPEVPAIEVLHSTFTAADPQRPGFAQQQALVTLLAETGVSVSQVAVFELVEAYSVMVLAALDTLGLGDDDPRLNAHGGALALGHPWAASGTIATIQAVQRLSVQPAGSLAVISAAVAGGMGVALMLRRG